MTGEEFKAIRESLGLSQGALAKILGISPQRVSDIECGEREVSKIIEAFMLHLLRDNARQIPKQALQDTLELAEGEALYVAVIPGKELPHKIILEKIQENRSEE